MKVAKFLLLKTQSVNKRYNIHKPTQRKSHSPFGAGLRCKDTTLFLILQISVVQYPLLPDTEFGEDVVEYLLGCYLTRYLAESGEAVLQVHTQELTA